MGLALSTRIEDGKPYLECKRPVSHKVDSSRRLLGTSKYASEDHCAVVQGTRTSGQNKPLIRLPFLNTTPIRSLLLQRI